MSTTLQRASGQTCEQLSSSDYHADPAIGSSMLETFRQSRRLYEALHITKTIPRDEPSDAMQLGTWIHTRILEPEKYFDTLADPLPEQAPDGKNWLRRKGSDHERWWADELAKREGYIAINEATRQKIENIAASVLSKKWSHSLLRSKGQAEYSIFWTDEQTGLKLKCRIDWFSVRSIDLKTTERPWPSAFVRTAVEYGFHRKRQHYLAGIRALTGAKDPPLLHVAVGTAPPHSCGAFNIGDFDSRMNAPLGLMEWRQTLNALAECYRTGDWSEFWEHEIMDLEYPPWAFTQQQYQL